MLKRELYSQEIHLQKGDTKRRKNTTDDRWVALYNYILEQMNTYGKPREDIVITTTLYRQLTNCTDYAARKELAQFCQEGSLHGASLKIKYYYCIRYYEFEHYDSEINIVD